MSFRRVGFAVFSTILLVILAVASAPLRATASSSILSVKADKSLGAINPLVYGAGYGPWGILPRDMLPFAASSGVTLLRFPGGDWGDLNDLTTSDIDLFMSTAHLMHAEPSISVRLKKSTPEIAAKLVHYVNIEQHYGVRYWSIGNEPNLFPDYSLEQYLREWRTWAKAMLAVDPSIILIGPEVSQYPPLSATDPDSKKLHEWLHAFLQANGDMVGLVSVHRYPFPLGQNLPATTIAQLKANAPEWDVIISDLRKVIRETTGHDLPIAITEFNSHWNHTQGGEASTDSFYNAVWLADVLGRMIRQRVDMVSYFCLSSYGNVGTYGLLGHDEPRPTYYVYQLYRQLGSELLESTSADADVTITAAKRRDGTLTLMVVNAALQPKSVSLDLTGFKVSGQAELWRLDPDHKAERIGSTDLSTNSLELPAQSVSLYIIPGG